MTGIKISVDRLQIGNYIKLPLSWKDHPFLFSSFLIKSQEEVELIRRLGLKQVIIFPDKSPAPPKPIQTSSGSEGPTQDALLDDMESKLAAEKERRIEQLKQYRRNLQRSEKAGAFAYPVAQSNGQATTRPLTAISEAQELVGSIVSNS